MSASPAGTRVLLVRHGQSTWNADARWQGQADPPLSALGTQQAVDAARHVDGVQALWSSDLDRARRTAELIGELLALGVHLEPRLRERHAGEWQGCTRDEIEERWPGYLSAGRRPPGFEPDDALLDRVLAALDELRRAHPGESVLVVTHGGIVRTIERHLGDEVGGLLPNLGGRWIVAPGEGGRDGDSSGWTLDARVLLLEDVQVTRPEQL
jgi:broad specificity phosphatase PhoE